MTCISNKTRQIVKEYVLDRCAKYRITHNMEVNGYGSANPARRDLDYWQYLGTVGDVVAAHFREIEYCQRGGKL